MPTERKWIDVDLGSSESTPSQEQISESALERTRPPQSASVSPNERPAPVPPAKRASSPPDDGERTVGPLQEASAGPGNREPVVGWLVCVEGHHRGQGFSLYPRRNTIGRGAEADVSLPGDPQVSRRHGLVTYDAQAVDFVVQVSEHSSQPIRVNGEPIYTPTRLARYDAVAVGGTMLLFVPFCTDAFSWTVSP